MDMTNLTAKRDVLMDYLHARGYAPNYIRQINNEFDWIQEHASGNNWSSYQDIYEQRMKGLKFSKSTIKGYRGVYALLQAFDINGQFPDGRHNKPLCLRGAYARLNSTFREIVDFAVTVESTNGLDAKNINNMKYHISCFFAAMQDRNCSTVDAIHEEDVLSFFIDVSGEDVTLIRGRSYMCNVRSMLTAALPWHEGACQKLLTYLPETRGIRKNFEYLKKDEIDSINKVLDEGELDMRDTAMVSLLLVTGMRSCDVTGLKLSSINWERDLIQLKQQKTGVELTLPLPPKVGNRIYDYLVLERPKVDSEYVFLTKKAPYQRMQAHSLRSVTDKVFAKAGIRLNAGSRKGCHIFRYYVATKMLENGVPAPVISSTIGQEHFSSLTPYIQADLEHLKQFALSVSDFTSAEGVFGNEED